MIDLSRIPLPIRNPNNCHVDPILGWPYSYGYRPSLAAGVIFSLLFALALFVHTFLAFRMRRWTSILLAVGALSESAPANHHSKTNQYRHKTIESDG